MKYIKMKSRLMSLLGPEELLQ